MMSTGYSVHVLCPLPAGKKYRQLKLDLNLGLLLSAVDASLRMSIELAWIHILVDSKFVRTLRMTSVLKDGAPLV